MLNIQGTMLKLLTICASFFIQDGLAACTAENQYPWSYHGTTNGPNNWVKKFPDCGKSEQSPIEIKNQVVLSLNYPDLTFDNFDRPVTKATVKNVGWTVTITPEDGVVRRVPWRGATFVLDDIHIHFGTNKNPGAEHVIEGFRSEAEMHFVIHKHGDPSTVVVVALILESLGKNNDGLNPIVDILPDIMYRDDSKQLQSQLDLSSIFSKSSSPYYFYEGRNSIPPCEPNYNWLILKNTADIGDDQLDKFNALYSVLKSYASNDCKMGQNYRPIQPVGCHRVYSSN